VAEYEGDSETETGALSPEKKLSNSIKEFMAMYVSVRRW
jgi:hypothetical protein